MTSKPNNRGTLSGAAWLDHWRFALVLLLASCCAYLSVNLHRMDSTHDALKSVVLDMEALGQPPIEPQRPPHRWMSGLYVNLPRAENFSPAARPAQELIAKLASQAATGDPIDRLDQVAVAIRVASVLDDLRSDLHIKRMEIARLTHVYYACMIALVIVVVVVLMLRRQRNVGGVVLRHLLGNDTVFAQAPVPLSVCDADDRIVRTNRAFEQITGFEQYELRGSPGISEESPEEQITAQRMRRDLDRHGHWIGDYHLRCKDGSVAARHAVRMTLGDDIHHPDGYLTIAMESAASDTHQRLMLWQAHHDNLTKLPNVNLLEERLSAEIRQGRMGGLVSIDLNGFKKINDSLGHAAADRVLMDAAMRIAMAANEHDTVARIAGDLFVVMVTNVDEVGEIERVARNALMAFETPFFVEDRELFVDVSAGIAVFPDDGEERGELFQKADAARLLAKQRGGSHVCFYEQQMNADAARRFDLETRLRGAIDAGELEIYYQPIIDISSFRIYGAEALLRWNNVDLGMVSPGEFIPIAEDSGLIVALGKWVVSQVKEQLAVWSAMAPDIRVSVNVSARQFANPVQAAELLALFAGERAERITVELTESAVVHDAPGAQAFLQGLRDLGIRIALDDFGTGYSSVGYLRDFEFDLLKVDKSFIDHVSGARDLGLIASIVAMGRILGMQVVAEGVEHGHQVERLQQIGCDFVQGFYYSKPLPAEDFANFVQGWTHSVAAVSGDA